MNLKTKIFVRSISSLSDARYCAGMGVDMLGFDTNQNSSSYVDPEKFNQITSWVAVSQIVIQTSESTNLDEINRYKADIVETNNTNNVAKLKKVYDTIMLSLEVNKSNIESIENAIIQSSDQKDFIALDFENPEILLKSFGKLSKASRNAQIFINTDFKLEQLNQILDLNPYGLVLEAGIEEKVGFKEYDELADILEALQLD